MQHRFNRMQLARQKREGVSKLERTITDFDKHVQTINESMVFANPMATVFVNTISLPA
jgi:hypothetical protein